MVGGGVVCHVGNTNPNKRLVSTNMHSKCGQQMDQHTKVRMVIGDSDGEGVDRDPLNLRWSRLN